MTFISWNYQRGSRAEWGGSLRYYIPFPESNKTQTDLIFFGLTAFGKDVCDSAGEPGTGKVSPESKKIHSYRGSFHICVCPASGWIWLVSKFRSAYVEEPRSSLIPQIQKMPILSWRETVLFCRDVIDFGGLIPRGALSPSMRPLL